MKLIVGLGNPGGKYAATRHNVGFDVITELVRRHSDGKAKANFQGETFDANIRGQRVLLLVPLTYMNRSGGSVQPARDFYQLDNRDVLVICDDFNLPLGKLRVKSKGSAGGQKGLNHIIQRLGGQDVPRLRIGIGEPPPQWDVADYVLSKFKKDELPEIDLAIQKAADAAEAWVSEGIETCMNQTNGA